MNQKNYTKTKWFRGIAFALAFLLAMPSALANVSTVSADDTVGSTSGSVVYGDVDGDNAILAADALLALKHAAKLETLEGDAFKAANVTGGEKLVDAADALLILQYAAKLIDKFPVEGEEPDVTETPIVTETTPVVDETPTPTPVITIIPTEEPTPVPTATPPAPWPSHITEENASEYAVEGIPVVVENLNGAEEYTADPNGAIYTFTDTNASKRTGIKIQNPIVGNADYQQDYGFVRDLEDPTGQGRVNVFDLFGSALGWNRDEDKLPLPEDQALENPDADKDNRVWYVAREDEVYYPKPSDAGNLKGFSMSFWAKTNKAEDNSAILTFANTNQTTTVNMNAAANYSDTQDSENFFSTSQRFGETDTNYRVGEWDYYTVTFANDWICVYINGVEVKYDQIELQRDKMRSFNNGFLTRYNTAVTWTQEDFDKDWRGYLNGKQEGSSDLYPTITSDEFTVFGNGRFRGLGASTRLMLTFMTGMTTEVYLGGAVVEAASGAAKYSSESGTQIAQVKYYLDELDWEQAYANYLLAETPVYVSGETETPGPDDSDKPIETETPPPSTDPLDGKVLNIIKNWGNINENVESPNGNPYHQFSTLVEVDGEYYGAKMENPFELNTNITQTIEEALEGQEKIPYTVQKQKTDDDGNLEFNADGTPIMEDVRTVAGDGTAVQYYRGNYYSDYYYGDPTKYGNFQTDAEKNPATATEKYAFQKPVWTKGASVGFWFNPSQALIDSKDPIWTMGKANEYFFTLAADGTVQFYDGQGISFKGGQIPFKANMQCYNTFTANGDASKIEAGKWHYYLVTFANDWIQVYVDGNELIYSMAGITRGYTKHFNAGFLTRHNNIGMVTEDPDPLRQYITNAQGLTVLPEVIDETVTGNDETCVRSNGVYNTETGYYAETDKGEFGSQYRLMMDSLTVEGGNFYMGGYATAYKKSAGWASNAIKTPFYTDHTISDGSAFADVRFYEFEATAQEAYDIFKRRLDTCPGDVVVTDTPTPPPVTETPPPTDTPTPPPVTETPPPTDTPPPTNVPAEPITYDAETDTYTMHGTETVNDGSGKKPENGAYKIANPFAGLDLDEELTLDENNHPVYTKGATISYWVKVPANETLTDAVTLTFTGEAVQTMHKDDYDKYVKCQNYSEEDASYSMGTMETYVTYDAEGNETGEVTVLEGAGKNVQYNPNYPAEGYYKVDANGTIDAVKKGADASAETSWVKLKAIGTGLYAQYSKRFEEEGGENSQIRESMSTAKLNLYASGSVEFWEDDMTGTQLNPNHKDYGTLMQAQNNNKLILWTNNNPYIVKTHGDWAKGSDTTSPALTTLDQWHQVTVVITNDYIQYYIDGTKLTVDYYNWWGTAIDKQFKNMKAFNYGYGPKDYWISTNPSVANSMSRSIMDVLTDPNTTLEVGGQNPASTVSGLGMIGTTDGVQIKDLKFYSTAVAAENITADGVVNVEAIDYSKLSALELKELNSSATVDENGVYTFNELVAQDTTTFEGAGTNAETGEKEDIVVNQYYGVEFENPFAGNTRIQQTVAEALENVEGNFVTSSLTDDAAKAFSGQAAVGRENNFQVNSPIGFGDTYTAPDGTVYNFQRPVYTKGATVSFWYNPANLEDKSPIFTMYGENEGLFAMLSDGTVAYFDMCNAEWKNGQSGYNKGFSHSTNGFYAKGDASKVTAGAWNYYTITFANDWIQVYINGEELVYTFVSLELQAKTMGNHFNGGFGYRYSPTGMLTEDTSYNNYVTKSTVTKNGNDGILDVVTAEDGTTSYADPDGIARNIGVRSTSIYRRANNYWLEDKGDNGVFLELMMNRLTAENMRFFIGGLPTEMSASMNLNLYNQGKGFNPTQMQAGPANKAVGVDESIDTNHGQVGSQFKDVKFAEKEYTAEEVKAEYESMVLNPITYDEETDTYTMNGQNFDSAATNAAYEIANPFAGLDLDEELTLDENNHPVYTKGVTIAYWVKTPASESLTDAVTLTFTGEAVQTMHKDDYDKYVKCQNYSEEDASYSMGTMETYVTYDAEGNETGEVTVLSGQGKNVQYNPNYPAEGYYKVDANGTIDAVKKGADVSAEDSWVKLKAIGTGLYAQYSKRFEEEGGENSQIREAMSEAKLNLYASGSVEFWEDDMTGTQLNPNHKDYGTLMQAQNNNKFILWTNNNPYVVNTHGSWAAGGDKTSPALKTLDQWHFVTVVITNDYIQYYIDGTELTVDYYNWWGSAITGQFKNMKAFNYGYGPKDYWISTNPSVANSMSRSIMDVITDPNTKLEIGGQNPASTVSGLGMIGTTAGVQVKGLEFYSSVIPEAYITADGLDFSKVVDLEVKNVNSNATVDGEGVYTFGELVAQGETVFPEAATNAETGVKEDIVVNQYYGVEFENPFAGNTRIQQTVAEALAHIPEEERITHTMADSRAVNNGGIVGRENNFTIDSGIGFGDTYTTEDGSKTYTFQRPVYTKGASVSFWYNPANLEDKSPIFTMYGENEGLFTMLSDGTVAYFDMCNAEWKNGHSGYNKGWSHSTNGFYAKGDATKVTQGEWNYYTITFANDWIQVYINGEELVYTFVSLELVAKTLGNHFNGGFGYRYSPTGMLTEDTSYNQYVSKSSVTANGNDAILDLVTAEDGTTSYADPDGIARNMGVRVTSIYRRANNYWLEDKGDNGVYLELMMNRLTAENMRFFIGGLPTEMSAAMNLNIYNQGGFNPSKMQAGPANKAVGVEESIDTNHGQVGSKFKNVTFVEKELTAEEAKSLYDAAYVEANPTPEPTATPEPVEPSDKYTFDITEDVTLNSEINNAAIVEAVNALGETTNVIQLGAPADGVEDPYGVELGNPLAGKIEYNQSIADGLVNANAVLSGDIKSLLVDAETYYQVAATAVEGVTYPRPVYTNGVVFNAWVKVPEGATAATPLISWHKNDEFGMGTLTVMSDGRVGFLGGGNANGVRSDRNAVMYTPADASVAPLAKAGQWVYITVAVENYQIQAYFDGVKADMAPDANFAGTNGKMFNKGFSYYGNDDPATNEDRRNNYRDLLKAFTKEEVDAFAAAGTTAGADVTKFEYLNSGAQLLVDYMTDADTTIYLGGLSETLRIRGKASNVESNYKAATAGVQLDDISMAAFATGFDPDTYAANAYATATGANAISGEDFEDASDVVLNDATNTSKIETVVINSETGATSKVVTLGAPAEGVEDTYGVEIANPLAGKTEYNQTIADGLTNANAVLSGDIKSLLVDAETYYQVAATAVEGVTYPRPVYTNGVMFSAWVKVPEGATAATPLISWHKNDEFGMGTLTVMSDGRVGFLGGGNANGVRSDRNAVMYTPADASAAPLAKAGQWVYITVAVENYQIQAYFDGVKATMTPDANFAGTNGKMFNKGFSYYGNDDPATNEDRRNNYRDLLKAFTKEEVDAFAAAGTTAGADVTKFEYLNSGAQLLVDYMTDADTKIYLGGLTETLRIRGKASNVESNYKAATAGVQLDDITANAYTGGFDADTLAAEAYAAAAAHK